MSRIPKTTRRRGGVHEAAGPGDLPPSVAAARAAFLAAVRELVPAVLADLGDEPYRAAQAVWRDDLGIWRWSSIMARATADPTFAHLRDAVITWSERYHLTADWCLAVAARTLALWCLAPGAAADRAWFAVEVGRRVPYGDDQTAFHFDHPGWHVAGQRRAEAVAAIRQAFEMDLDAYLDRMDHLAQDRGLTLPPEHRGADHLRWLALYQAAGYSQAEIAQRYHVERATARDGLHAAAEAIGLPLRPPSRPGRPRKASPA